MDQNPVKGVLFVPHTPGSVLAKELRENEEKLFQLTGWKVKVVERSGTTLQDALTSSNPWKGEICERENCLICLTKSQTGKGMSQDCKKRNLVYETWCRTCETEALDKLRQETTTELDFQAKSKEIALYKYIGESGRSSFERGWEHLDTLARLSKESHMLRHVVDKHEGQDLGEVVFGMRILSHARSAFERQIREAIKIEKESKKHHILNSKSEYHHFALPRLIVSQGSVTLPELREEVKKLKQAKVEGKMPVLKKEKKIPAVKVVKKVKKESCLAVKEEEVAPVTKMEEKEVAMEQDTISSSPAAKFDEAMMEEYDEDAVEDEFLEELAEKKILSPQKKFNKQNKATNKQKDGNLKIERQETKKELWGSEEDGGWYASSEKIVARFKLKDLVLDLGKEAFPSQVDWMNYICPYLKALNPNAKESHVYILAKAKWFEAQRKWGLKVAKGRKIVINKYANY